VTDLARLLAPRSVAVIGASGDPGKTSGRPVHYLLRHGYRGAIHPVNPRLDRIGELTCHPDIARLPEVPDVAIVLLGVERAEQAVRELAARGVAAAIVLGSGYAETGAEGESRQRRLIEAAGSMRLLGPNTIGLVNLIDGIVLSASGALEMAAFEHGPIGLVSQSGGILGSLLSRAAARGIGLSRLVCTGNEADLDLADWVDALVDDPATAVIALYVEGVRRPAAFSAAARRAWAAGKPVVAYKVGRSEAGVRAAISHTGALAGSDSAYQAFFEDLGIIRAQRFADLLDIASALARGRRPRGPRVAILTSTGGAGTLLADSLGACGLETPPPDPACAAALRAIQPGEQGVYDRNPIDVTLAGLQPDLLRGALRALLASPAYDALLVVVGSSSLAQPELMAGAIVDSLPLSDKPILAYLSPHAPQVGRVIEAAGVPVLTEPESCAAVLEAMLRVSEDQRGLRSDPLSGRDRALAADPDGSPPLGDLGLQADGAGFNSQDWPAGVLDESRSRQLFARFGIESVPETVVSRPAEAERAARAYGARVVLKVLDEAIAHKSEVGGVATGLAAAEVGHRLEQMSEQVQARLGRAPERFLVQPMIEGGVEMLLGLRTDPLGCSLLLGIGGGTAELQRDSLTCLIPEDGRLESERVLRLLRQLRHWPLLDGFRGRQRADVPALIAAAQAMARLAITLSDRLLEAEINPLIVLPEGQGVRAVDGLIVLA